MRIVHLNLGGPDVSVDGIATVVATLSAAQTARGEEVIAYTDGTYRARGVADGMMTALRLRREIIDGRPDVVHMHSAYRPAHAVLACFLRRAGVAYVVSPHSGFAVGSRSRRRVWKWLYLALIERRLLANARVVLCLSDVERNDVRAVSPRAAVTVVANPGPQPDSIDVPVEVAEHLLTLCRFDVQQKGLDILVDIAGHLPSRRFRVFGEVDVNEPDRAMALIAGASPNVTFEAPVRGGEKEQLLRSAQAYLQPSRWEGQSMSVLEALAAGTPCIVSQYVAQTLGDELARLVVVIDDDPSVAATQIEAALSDRTVLVRAAQEARTIVSSRYSADAICDELDRAYGHTAVRERQG